MKAGSDILLVSNGYGEAAITGYIGRAIANLDSSALLEHFPLVGRARADAWPHPVGPQQDMPSGGLVANINLRNLSSDLRSGLLSLLTRQMRFLRAQRQRSVIIAVGDVFCVALSLLAARPTIFVATAKSDYVSPHSAIERWIARKATLSFARDEPTALSLQASGVRAEYAGNVMMDGIRSGHVDVQADPGAARFGILPGSRPDAPRVAAAMLGRLVAIARQLQPRGQRTQAFMSVAPSVDALALVGALRSEGFAMPDPGGNEGIVARATHESLEVVLVQGAFGDVLAASQIILGQAGTANEQAAGAGRPVVAALEPGENPKKMLWYRMRQKRLLGDALLVLPSDRDEFARGVVQLIEDPRRMTLMGEVGQSRMGHPGGAVAVAAAALKLASSRP